MAQDSDLFWAFAITIMKYQVSLKQEVSRLAEQTLDLVVLITYI